MISGENLIKYTCRRESEILLLTFGIYLINIHHAADAGYMALILPNVPQNKGKIKIPAAHTVAQRGGAARGSR